MCRPLGPPMLHLAWYCTTRKPNWFNYPHHIHNAKLLRLTAEMNITVSPLRWPHKDTRINSKSHHELSHDTHVPVVLAQSAGHEGTSSPEVYHVDGISPALLKHVGQVSPCCSQPVFVWAEDAVMNTIVRDSITDAHNS